MTLKKGLIATIVLAFAAFAVAGCGDGDNGSASGSASAANEASEPSGGSKGEDAALGGSRFVQRANAICAAGKEALLAETARIKGSPFSSRTKRLKYSQEVLEPAMRRQIETLKELSPPSSAEQQVEAFLVAWAHVLDFTAQESIPIVNKIGAAGILDHAGDLARRLGLETCVYG